MHRAFLASLAAAGALAACSPADRSGVSAPQFAHVQDLDGTPDLIVDGKRLADSWVVYEQELKESFCSISEGGTTPGFHRVLRMTVTTPNIGDADIAIGDPNVHWDPNGDGDPVDSDGLFELSTCHRHFHFRNYATYELLSADRSRTWLAAKHGFCMIDVTPWNNNDGGVSSWVYRSCGRPARDGLPAIAGNQGISVGYADTYFKWLGGMCHNFLESNYDNNVAEVAITIPDHPGKTGFGPGGGQNAVDEIVDDENRPDK